MAASLPQTIAGAKAGRGRQPSLFLLENPLTQRFGQAYFAALPQEPGVYFFSDEHGRLLYIGQSANLRARIGSYRHVTPGRHARRTLRLVARIRTIEWEPCETPAAAIERERVLLLERRPPFNRAGVWQGAPWWLEGVPEPRGLRLILQREAAGIGPLPPGFRHLFGPLVRGLYRLAWPEAPLHRYPHGLTWSKIAPELRLPLPAELAEEIWRLCRQSAAGEMSELLERLAALPSPASQQEANFWQEECERLESYGQKPKERKL